jgi:hypothetical protein
LARFLDHVISLKTREDLNKLYLLAGRKRAALVSLILYRNLINQALGVAQCQMGLVYVEVFGVHQVFHRASYWQWSCSAAKQQHLKTIDI